MAAGMSEDQVASELTKMVAFINKEAEEKAKEIQIKANEEYEIEKAEIVRAEIASIDKSYQQKYKQASMSQQITKSTTANKTRLNVLTAKSEVLDEIFQDAETELKKVSKDKKKYEALLTELIVQGATLLKGEDSIILTIREADADVIKRAIKAASSKVEDDLEIKIDETKNLDPDGAGGVVVASGNGKIVVDNTLEERLKVVGFKAMPRLRLDLFGFSKTRRFFD